MCCPPRLALPPCQSPSGMCCLTLFCANFCVECCRVVVCTVCARLCVAVEGVVGVWVGCEVDQAMFVSVPISYSAMNSTSLSVLTHYPSTTTTTTLYSCLHSFTVYRFLPFTLSLPWPLLCCPAFLLTLPPLLRVSPSLRLLAFLSSRLTPPTYILNATIFCYHYCYNY